MIINAGYPDDLVPAVEELRYYNRTRSEYPDQPITLFFGSLGHPRGQTQANVSAAFRTKENEWTDYYLGGQGTKPPSEVISYTQTCPADTDGGGPYVASDWASLSPGEIRLEDPTAQIIGADGGTPSIASAWNGVFAGQNPCSAQSGAKEPGSANWDLAPAPAAGYTLQGSPTVDADIDLGDSPNSEIAARLVDLSPDGATKTLIARGVYRPWPTGFQVFQLNPNGWHVDEGHYLRLELLPFDGGQADAATGTLANFGRPTNNQPAITVEDLQLRIPVREQPGAVNGLVKAPVKRVLPDRPDVALAPGNEAIGSQTVAEYVADAYPCPEGTSGPGGGDCTPNPVIGKIQIVKATVKGKTLTAQVKCAGSNDSCAKATVKFKGAPKKGKKGRGVILAKKSGVTAAAGKTVSVRFNLTGKARKLFRDSKKRKVVRKHGRKKVKYVKVKGLKSLRSQVLVNGKGSGYLTVKRTGKVK